jgi:hypothetical protein
MLLGVNGKIPFALAVRSHVAIIEIQPPEIEFVAVVL